MIIFSAIVLLLSAVFSLVVWPQFWKRVTSDPRATDDAGNRTRFYTVHAVLIGIAMVLAILSLVAGIGLFFV